MTEDPAIPKRGWFYVHFPTNSRDVLGLKLGGLYIDLRVEYVRIWDGGWFWRTFFNNAKPKLTLQTYMSTHSGIQRWIMLFPSIRMLKRRPKYVRCRMCDIKMSVHSQFAADPDYAFVDRIHQGLCPVCKGIMAP